MWNIETSQDATSDRQTANQLTAVVGLQCHLLSENVGLKERRLKKKDTLAPRYGNAGNRWLLLLLYVYGYCASAPTLNCASAQTLNSGDEAASGRSPSLKLRMKSPIKYTELRASLHAMDVLYYNRSM